MALALQSLSHLSQIYVTLLRKVSPNKVSDRSQQFEWRGATAFQCLIFVFFAWNQCGVRSSNAPECKTEIQVQLHYSQRCSGQSPFPLPVPIFFSRQSKPESARSKHLWVLVFTGMFKLKVHRKPDNLTFSLEPERNKTTQEAHGKNENNKTTCMGGAVSCKGKAPPQCPSSEATWAISWQHPQTHSDCPILGRFWHLVTCNCVYNVGFQIYNIVNFFCKTWF